MDERTLQTGDLQLGTRMSGGILHATCDGIDILVKDAANRERGSLRQCVPTGTDLKREYATYLFAKLVGTGLITVPAMAWRTVNGKPALAMEKVRGAHAGWAGELPKGTSVTTKRNLALFDAIVGNTDRHGQNYFVQYTADRKIRIVGIDHGLCFPIPDSRGNIDCGSSDWLRNESLPKWAVTWLMRILRQETKIRQALQPYLEPAAIDGMFTRIDWMLRKNCFMARRRLQDYANPNVW